MTISLQVLFDTNVDTVRAAADAWNATADHLDDACENLIKGTRDLEYQWPDGPAAGAAHAKTREARNEASNAVPPCRTIARALREFADTIRSLQGHLREITAEANRAGFQVDIAHGTVSAPQHMYQSAGSGAHVVAQQCNSFMWQLDALVKDAAAVDSRTSATITANLPDARKGFGSLSAPQVPLQQVEGMKGKSPQEVNKWWNGLTAEQQDQVLRDYPHLAGNMDGVPAEDRNTANRSWLSQKRQAVEATWTSLQNQLRTLDPLSDEAMRLKEQLAIVHDERRNLAGIQQGLDRAGDRGMLLGIDPSGDGKAIIAIGNPDSSTHTAVWVPGLGTDSSSTRSNVERMIWLNDAAQQHLDPGESVSTVYWLGYDAPDLDNTSVVGEERSRAGKEPYLNFMQGMRVTHDGAEHHLTAMGHSYGSTVVGEAAMSGRLPVDDIITQGSPGTHAGHANQLMPDPRHVWAGASSTDPVSGTKGVNQITTVAGGILGTFTGVGPVAGAQIGDWIGEKYTEGHGISPHYQEFGANRYHVDTGGHSDYWNENSQSVDNQAAIIAGDYSAVGMDHGQAPEDWD